MMVDKSSAGLALHEYIPLQALEEPWLRSPAEQTFKLPIPSVALHGK